MIEQDTVKLLRECDAGIKMGVYSIEEVLGDVNNSNFKQMLEKAKSDHQQLQDEIQILLDKYPTGVYLVEKTRYPCGVFCMAATISPSTYIERCYVIGGQ